MRKLVFVAIVACVTTASWAQSGKEAKTETLLRWSFAGTHELAANKNLKVFKTIRDLPEAAAMRDAIATNLASSIAARYNPSIGSNTAVKIPGGSPAPMNVTQGVAALIQPLWADLVQHESRFQMDTRGAQDADWILAIKLPEDRTATWSRQLTQLAVLSGMKGAAEAQPSWTATRDEYKLSFSRSKDWVILQGGFGAEPKFAKSFRDSLGKRSGKQVLNAEINTPALANIWKAPSLAHYPKLTIEAEPRGDGFQSELTVDYPQDLGIKHEKWNVPDELILDPLIGFTAIQGIQKKLASLEAFKVLGAKKTPNQLFLWSQGIGPFSVSMAADVSNPGEVVTNTARYLERNHLPSGRVQIATNRTAATWLGLPIATPFMEAATAPNQGFVVAGLFPAPPPDPQPMPKELIEQLKQKDLVYYDWEITGERIRQWMPIWQLYYLVGTKLTPDGGAPSQRFLQALRAKVGNTITAGTLEKPNQIKFTRQSHLGFSALELVLLSHYLDSRDLRAGKGNVAAPAPTP